MININRIGVEISDNEFACTVVLAIAMQHKNNGIIVLAICQIAILLSLAMYGLRLKSMRLSGVGGKALAVALVKKMLVVGQWWGCETSAAMVVMRLCRMPEQVVRITSTWRERSLLRHCLA